MRKLTRDENFDYIFRIQIGSVIEPVKDHLYFLKTAVTEKSET